MMIWGYKRAFARCALLIVAGVALQFIFGDVRTGWLRYPAGVILAVNYIYILIFLSVKSDKWHWVRQLSDHYASVSSIACMLAGTILLGFFPIARSWYFCIMMLYFITVLGMRAIEEIWHWRHHSVPAVLLHSAVFIVLAAAFFGNGDKLHARMTAEVGESSHIAFSQQTGRAEMLPFVITLEEFIVEEEPPMFLSRIKVTDRKGERHFDVRVNHPAKTGSWSIYQAGYDKEKGTSTLECVRDGWFPLVKTGLWMILAGGLAMGLTAGYKRRERR